MNRKSNIENSQFQIGTIHILDSAESIADFGAIILCKKGEAQIIVNFRELTIQPGYIVFILPNDTFHIRTLSEDFSAKVLKFSSIVLREASNEIEPVIYETLRSDCCWHNYKELTQMSEDMLNIISFYYNKSNCTCLTQIGTLQLKSYFIGYYDFLRNNPSAGSTDMVRSRANALFTHFMHLLERDYRLSHDVGYFAERLSITPKHLNVVAGKCTGRSVKTVIDEYVTMQIKVLLKNSSQSVSEIAWNMNFSSVSFFCRYFKRQTGKTPEEFRRNP